MLASDTLHLIFAFLASLIAGAINSVAGGGTLISFPILLALGLPPVIANATNTVGIWSGSAGSLWAFRNEIKNISKFYLWLILPSFVGAVIGAYLLRLTPSPLLEKIVPWLIFFATLLFMIQNRVRKFLLDWTQAKSSLNALPVSFALVLQLGVAIYGGYFGAGMGILMLSVLGVIGLTDILEMTAMTSLLAMVINGVAGIIFIYSGLISWPIAVVMALGSLI